MYVATISGLVLSKSEIGFQSAPSRLNPLSIDGHVAAVGYEYLLKNR